MPKITVAIPTGPTTFEDHEVEIDRWVHMSDLSVSIDDRAISEIAALLGDVEVFHMRDDAWGYEHCRLIGGRPPTVRFQRRVPVGNWTGVVRVRP